METTWDWNIDSMASTKYVYHLLSIKGVYYASTWEREREREGGAGVLIYLGASGGFAHWAPSSALPLAYWGSQGIPQTPVISIDPPINKS